MTASPSAVTSPNTDGGNALATLLARAAASMQRHHLYQQPQATTNANTEVHTSTSIRNTMISNGNGIASITAPTIDKDSNCAAKLIASMVNGSSKLATEPIDCAQMRNLESWHDEDEEPIDDSCYQELVDPSNSKGWSADEMFKYNERMHKITSSYNERTLSDNYTTPLPKINSKTTMRLATQLAKEIEDRVRAEGRITPESSDDDELFETERMQRVQHKHKRQSDHSKNQQRQSQFQLQQPQQLHHHNQHHHHQQQNHHHQQQHRFTLMNNVASAKTTKSSSQYSNSTETPATASLSSSPSLNDNIIIKPVTSSSRNILRTCLT